MRKLNLMLFVFVAFFLTRCGSGEKFQVKTDTDKNGYKYEYVTNDPLQVRIYTLKNGLKVYLKENKDEPRVQTYIAVRAGSKFDPKETMGLAHYLEHMMFKGSDKIGTMDWGKEKVVLQQISDLYEKRLATNNEEEKKAIYVKIDSLSTLAAQYAVANEYDKMISQMGAKNTNAHTGFEETVYQNDIPSNELERWAYLERERFGKLVLRLFHTELETVYEEFNMYQDDDGSKLEKVLWGELFKNHTYGTQSVIGKAEHLKNPSMVNIYNYFNTYYVPNNMAICISGDIDFDATIKMLDKYWGDLKPKELPEFKFSSENVVDKPVVKEVLGPSAEFLAMAYRTKGINTEDEKYFTLIKELLINSKAGLIDLDLNQKQKVQGVFGYAYFLTDYGVFAFYGTPREGQKLEEVNALILQEIEKIKKGEFDDWLLKAVINNLRLNEIKSMESNATMATYLYKSFTSRTEWVNRVKFLDELSKITKQQIVDFAKNNLKNDYVVVYKRIGKDNNIVHVEKPKLTPVEINRNGESDFMKTFKNINVDRISPVFVDYKKEIQNDKLNSGIELSYIKNKTNEYFDLNYIIDMGKNHDKKLALAVSYLPYIGTSKFSAEDIQKEFFKLGLTMNVSTSDDRSYVYINGLEESLEKGLELFEHVLSDAKADPIAYKEFVQSILKNRADAKLDKSTILQQAMISYGKYGEKSPFTDILSEEELMAINPEELVQIIKNMCSYKHHIFYYGQKDINDIKPIIDKYHKVPAVLKDYPKPIEFVEQPTEKSKVCFVNYDMVQVEVLMLSKDIKFNKELIPAANLFNQFYGNGGLSSITFQEIREAKALAYSAMSVFTIPNRINKSHYVIAFLGTQSDKLNDALMAMNNLMNNMPEAEKQFVASKDAILRQIETDRIIKSNIFWKYQENMDKGIDYDYRKDIYEKVGSMNIQEMKKFFDEHIKGKQFTLLVLGNKGNLNMNLLKKYGDFKELTLNEIFNY